MQEEFFEAQVIIVEVAKTANMLLMVDMSPLVDVVMALQFVLMFRWHGNRYGCVNGMSVCGDVVLEWKYLLRD